MSPLRVVAEGCTRRRRRDRVRRSSSLCPSSCRPPPTLYPTPYPATSLPHSRILHGHLPPWQARGLDLGGAGPPRLHREVAHQQGHLGGEAALPQQERRAAARGKGSCIALVASSCPESSLPHSTSPPT
eukprot:1998380-Pyramimonas_sp.AAC.1